jgi:hypothetical protein
MIRLCVIRNTDARRFSRDETRRMRGKRAGVNAGGHDRRHARAGRHAVPMPVSATPACFQPWPPRSMKNRGFLSQIAFASGDVRAYDEKRYDVLYIMFR